MSQPKKLETNYDAVIVGGGHNGLVAANYLAGSGLRVLVLEQHDELGGATVSQRVFPEFDALLSRYSYLVSLLPQSILDDLDIQFQTSRRSTASFTPYVNSRGIAGGLLISNVDESVSRQSFEKRTGNGAAWGKYQTLLKLESAMAGLAWPSLTKPLRSRQDFQRMLDNDDLRQAWKWFIERPLGEGIERFVDDDLIRGLVMTDAKIGVFTHPHDPSLIQNRCFLYHIIGRGSGEWQVPVGGMGALVEKLVDGARKRKCTLLTNARVLEVATGTKTHSIQVEVDGQIVAVDATRILFNASPKNFCSIMGQPWSPINTDEGSVVKVNMLLRRLPKIHAQDLSVEEAFTGSLHIDEGYQQMIDSFGAASRGRLPSPAPCEIYCHTLTDGTILSDQLRQQGYHTLTLFGLDVPYRLFLKDHDQQKREILDRYIAGIDKICAEPFIDCLAYDSSGNPCIEIKTAWDLEQDVGLDQGNIFHSSLSWFFTDDDQQIGTWGVETEYPRIYNCGSSAMRGGAVSGIPGHNAAKKIFEELRIR